MSGPAVILFDDVCRLCSRSVRFIIARDPDARFRFAGLGSPTADRLLAGGRNTLEGVDSVVLIEDGEVFIRSTAALRIARGLTAPWPLLYGLIVVPRPLRDLVYDLVARKRYRWFGRLETCLVPTEAERDRFLD